MRVPVDVDRGPRSLARHSIGVAMAGGNPKAGRHEADFYATPADVTLALLRRMPPGPRVWEPCCGDGAIARVLQSRGHAVVGSDVVDRGWGGHGGGHDVLRAEALVEEDVVTNPPFEMAEAVIGHLMSLRPRYVAMLLKSTFWHAKRRRALFVRHRPSAVLALSWRPDFANRGRPTMECAWTVWDASRPGPTEFDVLDRPSAAEVAAPTAAVPDGIVPS